eukprot:jgi/Mesen1/1522/ME001323S00378
MIAAVVSAVGVLSLQAAGPVECARHGWVNVENDMLACYCCGARLSFVLPPSWPRHHVERAAAEFAQKLSSGHKALCPWVGNSCGLDLMLFPPQSAAALTGSFQERCELLLHLPALPLVSKAAMAALRRGLPAALEHLLATAAPAATSASASYFTAQQVLAVCGWEPRALHPCAAAAAPAAAGEDDEGEQQSAAAGGSSAVLDCALCGASAGLWSLATVPRPPSAAPAVALAAAADSEQQQLLLAAEEEARESYVPPPAEQATATAAAAAAAAAGGEGEGGGDGGGAVQEEVLGDHLAEADTAALPERAPRYPGMSAAGSIIQGLPAGLSQHQPPRAQKDEDGAEVDRSSPPGRRQTVAPANAGPKEAGRRQQQQPEQFVPLSLNLTIAGGPSPARQGRSPAPPLLGRSPFGRPLGVPVFGRLEIAAPVASYESRGGGRKRGRHSAEEAGAESVGGGAQHPPLSPPPPPHHDHIACPLQGPSPTNGAAAAANSGEQQQQQEEVEEKEREPAEKRQRETGSWQPDPHAAAAAAAATRAEASQLGFRTGGDRSPGAPPGRRHKRTSSVYATNTDYSSQQQQENSCDSVDNLESDGVRDTAAAAATAMGHELAPSAAAPLGALPQLQAQEEGMAVGLPPQPVEGHPHFYAGSFGPTPAAAEGAEGLADEAARGAGALESKSDENGGGTPDDSAAMISTGTDAPGGVDGSVDMGGGGSRDLQEEEGGGVCDQADAAGDVASTYEQLGGGRQQAVWPLNSTVGRAGRLDDGEGGGADGEGEGEGEGAEVMRMSMGDADEEDDDDEDDNSPSYNGAWAFGSGAAAGGGHSDGVAEKGEENSADVGGGGGGGGDRAAEMGSRRRRQSDTRDTTCGLLLGGDLDLMDEQQQEGGGGGGRVRGGGRNEEEQEAGAATQRGRQQMLQHQAEAAAAEVAEAATVGVVAGDKTMEDTWRDRENRARARLVETSEEEGQGDASPPATAAAAATGHAGLPAMSFSSPPRAAAAAGRDVAMVEAEVEAEGEAGEEDKEEGEEGSRVVFDPLRQHRPYCPWVAGARPGWHLTLQALHREPLALAYHRHHHHHHSHQPLPQPAQLHDSESTASIFRGERETLAKVRTILGGAAKR